MSCTQVDPGWMSQRACIDVDPAVFFPEQGQTAAAAKAICATCPVTAECLALALENRELHGVWGGLTPRQRLNRGLVRPPKRNRVAPCGSEAGYYRHLRNTHTEPCGLCREAHAVAQRLRKHTLAIVR